MAAAHVLKDDTETLPAGQPGAESLLPADAAALTRLREYFRSFGLDDEAQLDVLARRIVSEFGLRSAAGGQPNLADSLLTLASQRVAAWSAQVLGQSGGDPAALETLGRAAFLLSNAPLRWPIVLLQDNPPEDFCLAMRAALPCPTPPERPLAMPKQRFEFPLADLRRRIPGLWRTRSLRKVGASGVARGRNGHRRRRRIESAASRRRAALVVVTAIMTALATSGLIVFLGRDGLRPIEVGLAVLFAANFAWIATTLSIVALGLYSMLSGRDRFGLVSARTRTPVPGNSGEPVRPSRTAIVVPVCNEDTARVFARIDAMWRSLLPTGRDEPFDLFVLSDSTRHGHWRAEEWAWRVLVTRLRAQNRIFYRHREVNTDRKSGNIEDFVRRWGAGYKYMIVLDADSLMAGDTMVRLVDLMDGNPTAGLIQTVPCAVNRRTLFGRIQQFSSRLYRPLLSAGLRYCQLSDATYWGHNAIIRIEAFARHCGLPHLPGRPPFGGLILSHDFVEAALLRRAGRGVWVEPTLAGSYEETPPTLLDHVKRDRRWCQGNLQHLRLLTARNLKASSRLYLAMGAMAYLSSVLWLLFLLLGLGAAATGAGAGQLQPAAGFTGTYLPIGILAAATVTVLFLPKLLSLAFALVHARTAQAFGGRGALLAGFVIESVFSALTAPVMMLFHVHMVAEIVLGRARGWASQRRSDNRVGWRESLAWHLPHLAAGTALALSAAILAPGLIWWLSPIIAGLVLAMPLTVLGSRRDIGLWARAKGLFLTPEELQTSAVLADYQKLQCEIEQAPSWQVVQPVALELRRRRRNALYHFLQIRQSYSGCHEKSTVPSAAARLRPR